MEIKDKNVILKEIKQVIESGKHQQAYDELRSLADPGDDFILQSKYAAYLRTMAGNLTNLQKIRVAVLASSTATHFNDILKFWLAAQGFAAEIYESDFSTIAQEVLDPQSRLYAFSPDVVLILTNYRDIKFELDPGAALSEAQEAVSSAVDECFSIWQSIRKYSDCYIIQSNADMPYQRVLGNYDGTAVWEDAYLLRAFNTELARTVEPGVAILDLEFLASDYGLRKWHENRFWYHSKHAFALNATGLVADSVARIIAAIKGLSKKCLVLDLDNTLWGGTIGDDGLQGIELGGNSPSGEAFVDFQKYLLKLKERGVVLAVCSKNDMDAAKEPFLNHPDMMIKLEDIVVFKANWLDKVSNIKEISETLNIGLGAMVFVDDNPAERALIRSHLPMVKVPELPGDPCDFAASLSSYGYFEAITFSDEDKVRSDLYQANAKRAGLAEQYTDLSGYLQSLQMEMTVGKFDDFNLPRIAQLINKSNQFHLTTTRYSEIELKSMMKAGKTGFYFKLTDRFGDNGLISAVILQDLEDGSIYIDTWVTSCRVLSRGVEEFIFSQIIDFAKASNVKRIIGRYIPTKKNMLAAQLYGRLHMTMLEDKDGATLWELALNDKVGPYASYIKKSPHSFLSVI